MNAGPESPEARLSGAREELSIAQDQRDHALRALEERDAETTRLRRQLAQLQAAHEQLRATCESLQDTLREKLQEVESLSAKVAELAAALFGASSEKRGRPKPPPDEDAPDGNAAPPAPPTGSKKRGRPWNAKGGRKIGTQVPRYRHRVEPESLECPGCRQPMQEIRCDLSTRVFYLPAQYLALEIERPVFACRGCRGQAPLQAPSPSDPLIRNGLADETLLAHVVVRKYADHQPFYRQSGILLRYGLDIGRATLCRWAAAAAFHLLPVWEALQRHVLGAARLFLDETTLPILEPGRGRTRTGYLWTALRDDAGFGGRDPPAMLTWSGPDRSQAVPKRMLADFTGRAQVDRYAGYNILQAPDRPGGPLKLQYCLAHWRRKFRQLPSNALAEFALDRFRELYRIEKEIRGQPPDQRVAVRQAQAAPVLEDLRSNLAAERDTIPPPSPLRKAIDYGLADDNWTGFTRFLNDGRLDIDNNPVENAHRATRLTVKNALFAGSEQGARTWAVLGSLIATCRLNGIDPEAWMAHALLEIRDGCKKPETLLPWEPFEPPWEKSLQPYGVAFPIRFTADAPPDA